MHARSCISALSILMATYVQLPDHNVDYIIQLSLKGTFALCIILSVERITEDYQNFDLRQTHMLVHETYLKTMKLSTDQLEHYL